MTMKRKLPVPPGICVPETRAVMHCAQHPKVETGLSCSRCATPMCPDCMVNNAVGMLCPACAGPTASAARNGPPRARDAGRSRSLAARDATSSAGIALDQYALAALVGIMVGTAAMTVFLYVAFYLFVFALAAGMLVGEVVCRLLGGYKGSSARWISAVSVVLGAFLGIACFCHGFWERDPIVHAFYGIAVIVALVGAVGRSRLR